MKVYFWFTSSKPHAYFYLQKLITAFYVVDPFITEIRNQGQKYFKKFMMSTTLQTKPVLNFSFRGRKSKIK